MKQRRVYATPNIAVAREAVVSARKAGVEDRDISLIARADIELDQIPDGRLLSETDFVPAALRGAGYGGVAGLLAGLAAVVLTPVGITIAGAAVAGAAGAVVGSWVSSMVGSSVPDPVRRKFEAEIEAGRVLVVLDAEDELLDRLGPRLAAIGAARLEYDAISSLD